MRYKTTSEIIIAIDLKPYEGLKQIYLSNERLETQIAIDLKPYEGLKRLSGSLPKKKYTIAIDLKPYEGLKRVLCLEKNILTILLQSI